MRRHTRLPGSYNMSKGLKNKKRTGLVLHQASKTAVVDCVQDTDEDDTESAQSDTESETESDDYNSESSESSNNKNEHVDVEERTEVLCNERVTFNVPGSSQENTVTDDFGISSEENNVPVISEEINFPVISE